MTMKRSGTDDPDFGRVPTGRVLPKRASERAAEVDPATIPARSPSVVRRQPGLRAAVHRLAARQGPVARRDRRVRQRDGAVPQPVAVPPRGGRGRRRLQGPHPAAAPRACWRRPRRRACSCPRSSTATGRSTATATTSSCGPTSRARPRRRGSPSPASASSRGCASPTSSAPSTAARPTTPPSTSSRWAAPSPRRPPRCSPRTATRSTCMLHGLGVEMAEALAELWHRRIREEWGFAGEDGPTIGGLFRQQYRGGRYSWGYPACPDLEDNATVAQPPRRRAARHRGQRGDRLAVPARADHVGHHLPPPAGEVLRRPLSRPVSQAEVLRHRVEPARDRPQLHPVGVLVAALARGGPTAAGQRAAGLQRRRQERPPRPGGSAGSSWVVVTK